MKNSILLIMIFLFVGYSYLEAGTNNTNKKNNNNTVIPSNQHKVSKNVDNKKTTLILQEDNKFEEENPPAIPPQYKNNNSNTKIKKTDIIKNTNNIVKKTVVKHVINNKPISNKNRKYFIKKNIEIKQLQLKLLELTQEIDKLNIKTSKLLKILQRKKDNILFFNKKNYEKKNFIKTKKKKEIKSIRYYKLSTNFVPLFLSMNFEKISPIHLLDNSIFKFEINNKNFYKLSEPLLIDKKIVKNGKVILSDDYKRAYLRNKKLEKVALIDKNSNINIKEYNKNYYQIINELFVYKMNLVKTK